MANTPVTTRLLLPRSALRALLGLALSIAANLSTATEGSISDCICVDSKASLVHLGSIDSFDTTAKGKEAAKALMEAMDDKHPEAAKKACDIYEEIIPTENFGGEYVALQWFCEYFQADQAGREAMLTDRYVKSYFDFLAKNNFEDIKDYIERKYHLNKEKTLDSPSAQRKQRFYEDFILFNNPRRERWEKSSKIMEVLGMKPGDKVADIGSGSGYFTFKFSEVVGDAGLVYALDNNKSHVDYLTETAKKLGIHNVKAMDSHLDGFELEQKVDHVYLCSLYHILYAYVREEHREPFVESIKKALKDDGQLIVVDNALVDDATLPYHGPYIAKELIIAQLRQFGFKLQAVHQIIPQRYVLTFKLSGQDQAADAAPKTCAENCLSVTSRASLVNMGLAEDHPTDAGRAADALMLKALASKAAEDLKAAREAYLALTKKENFGNEYSALIWFCDYLLTPEAERGKLTGPYIDEYLHVFADDDFSALRRYLKAKHELRDKPPEEMTDKEVADKKLDVTRDQMHFWMELLVYNNPYRPEWEKTTQILDVMKIAKGETLVDVGSGPGFYSVRFADLVGKEGKVIATDTNKEHREFVETLAKNHGLNVGTVVAKLDNLNVPDKVADVIFMGSLYDAVYAYSMEVVKDRLINSVRNALKPNGRLVILNYDHVDAPEIPHHGPHIDKRLIIQQLQHYGFKLVEQKQIIPQAYVLVFQAK